VATDDLDFGSGSAAAGADITVSESSAADDAESQILAPAFEEWSKLKLKAKFESGPSHVFSIEDFERGQSGFNLGSAWGHD
jgi:hypothetical protein